MEVCISLSEDKVYVVKDGEKPPVPSVCFQCKETVDEPPKEGVFIVVCSRGAVVKGNSVAEIVRGVYVPRLGSRGIKVSGDCVICIPED